jgi:hypothetical protein
VANLATTRDDATAIAMIAGRRISMHALVVTFDMADGLQALRRPSGLPARVDEYIADLRARPGFLAKTWLRDGDTYGGFYLFADRAAAERYLAEEIEPLGRANPAMANLQVRHFGVLEELSELTLGLPVAGVGI